MTRWRICVHALDRTGPPMLAAALIQWLRRHRAEVEVEVVAFRGGPLEVDLDPIAAVDVLLEPSEAWNHAAPDPDRVDQIRARLADRPAVDATLLVSVSAGQVLPLLPDGGPVITWVVERGEDLHWLGPPLGVAGRTTEWLAGCEGTRRELRSLLGGDVPVVVAPEFIAAAPPDPADVEDRRATLDPTGRATVMIGAGIGTHRKGPDLFLEVALAHRRRHPARARFVWIGGERDPLIPRLRREVERLDIDDVVFIDSVPDIDAWLAAADLLVHTARLDSFPLVCLHAAAAGTPVVAFEECGGVEEMLGGEFRGVEFPDVVAMSDLVEGTLSEAGPLGRRQQRRVLERFTADVAAPVVADRLAAAVALGGHQVRPLVVVAHEATRTGSPRVLLDLLRRTRSRLGHPLAVEVLAHGPLADELLELSEVDPTGADPVGVIINSSLAADAADRFDSTVPILVYVHEEGEALRNLSEASRSILADRAEMVLCVSRAARDDLTALGVAPRRIDLLPPLIGDVPCVDDDDDDRVAEVRHELSAPSSRLVMGCGEANWRKGADLFLDVVRRLSDRDGLEFAWVGRRPRGFGRVLDHDTRALELSHRVRWVGEVADPAPWMRAASLLLVTSREDPQPLVPLEAAIQGTPSIGFEIGGMTDLAQAGAVLVSPFPDTLGLAELAGRMLDDDAAGGDLVHAARLRVRTVHSPDAAGDAFVDAVARFLASRPTSGRAG